MYQDTDIASLNCTSILCFDTLKSDILLILNDTVRHRKFSPSNLMNSTAGKIMCGLKGSPSTSVTTSATTNTAALKNMSKPEYMYARTHVLRIFQRVSVLKKKDGANIYLSHIVLCIKTHGEFYIYINFGILSSCTEPWNGTRSMRISP